jgi:hypothetical protein
LEHPLSSKTGGKNSDFLNDLAERVCSCS